MQRIYLASRYSRRLELMGYAKTLTEMGYEITSCWVYGKHERVNGKYSQKEWALYARNDLWGINEADIFILFNDGEEVYGQGGRHVELGYALATFYDEDGRHIILIGKRENIFHHLPAIEHFGTWADFKASLMAIEKV